MNRTVIKIAALHRPAPQHLPVAVAGPADTARRLGAALSQQVPGASGIQPCGTERAAREGSLNRDMDPAPCARAGGSGWGMAGRLAASSPAR